MDRLLQIQDLHLLRLRSKYCYASYFYNNLNGENPLKCVVSAFRHCVAKFIILVKYGREQNHYVLNLLCNVVVVTDGCIEEGLLIPPPPAYKMFPCFYNISEVPKEK